MITKVFLDTNVIVNWMLLDAAVAEISQEPNKEAKLEVLRTKTVRRWPYYLVLEELRRRKPEGFKFGTSVFAVAESAKVIFDEYVAKKLHDAGTLPILGVSEEGRTTFGRR